jgi:hypothetical protein
MVLGAPARHLVAHARCRATTTHAATAQEGDAAIEDPAEYEAIARSAPFLTEVSLKLPASATALPQQMASLLSACSKLEDLTLHAYDKAAWTPPVSSLVDVDALLAAGPQLLHLRLPSCTSLTNLAPLRGLVNLQSLDMSWCTKVSDLVSLAALVNLQSLNICGCRRVSDLAPLAALLSLQSLDMSACHGVRDLAPLGALAKLRSLDMSWYTKVSDLAPLTALVNLHSLNITNCKEVSDLAPLGALVNQSLDISGCPDVSNLAPLGALVKLQSHKMIGCD